MAFIEEKAIEFAKKWEASKGREGAKDVRKDRLGYDIRSKGRKIEVKATKANIPNKAGLHITLLPRQYRALKDNPDYWIYRVYNVGRNGEEKVIPIPQKTILAHLKPYTVHKLVLEKEEWKQLEKEET